MRNLEQLQKEYSRSASQMPSRGFGGPGGGRGGKGVRPKGKPKNMKKTVARLLSYVGKYKFRLLLVLFCMLFTTVSSLFGGYLLAPIINRISFHVTGKAPQMSAIESLADGIIGSFADSSLIASLINKSDTLAVTVYVFAALVILGSVYLLSALSSYIQARLMLSVSTGAVASIRDDLFEKLQKLPVKYFDSNPTGEVMSRFTNDIDNIDQMLSNSLTSIVSGVVSLVGTFIFMLTTNIWLTLITVAFIPLFIFASRTIASRSSKFYSAQQTAVGAVNAYIEESVTGQKVIKVFNHEDETVGEFGLLNEDLRDKQFNAQFWGGIMGPIMNNVGHMAYSTTVGVGGVLMVLGNLTPGALTVFAGYSKQFSMPINQLSMQVATIFAALAGAERVFNVMDAEPEAPDAPDATEEPIEGHVILKNVSFGYTPDKIVLKNISLYAKPGQKIAFVGSTGAGKTTVTNLLNRFYDINDGEITIDGRDLRSFNREHLRKNIAMVLQDTHLFTGTVMENIRYGRLDATDEEVIDAAKTASAHSFIMRLKDGYNTILEGDGANLSQGQRQLLNIARAALSKAPILVLDEATSSVDTRTERHIEHGMDRLMKNRTTFVIAHRLSTVRNANAIMVLEQGEIIERGDHDDLLKMEGRYYELYTGKKELD